MLSTFKVWVVVVAAHVLTVLKRRKVMSQKWAHQQLKNLWCRLWSQLAMLSVKTTILPSRSIASRLQLNNLLRFEERPLNLGLSLEMVHLRRIKSIPTPKQLPLIQSLSFLAQTLTQCLPLQDPVLSSPHSKWWHSNLVSKTGVSNSTNNRITYLFNLPLSIRLSQSLEISLMRKKTLKIRR